MKSVKQIDGHGNGGREEMKAELHLQNWTEKGLLKQAILLLEEAMLLLKQGTPLHLE